MKPVDCYRLKRQDRRLSAAPRKMESEKLTSELASQKLLPGAILVKPVDYQTTGFLGEKQFERGLKRKN